MMQYNQLIKADEIHLKEDRLVNIISHPQTQEFKKLLEQGIPLKPLIIFREKDGSYELLDGIHRLAAYYLKGVDPILCHVKSER
jgi:hypothetical protein